MKKEFPSFLEPGFHDMELHDLEKRFAEPFGEESERHHIVERFLTFVERVRALIPTIEIWVDGSFTTEKEVPADVDAVIFVDSSEVNALSDDDKEKLEILFEPSKKLTIKHQYRTDAYLAPKDTRA